MTRRETIGLLGAVSAVASLSRAAQNDAIPSLAPGPPLSRKRIALVDAFRDKAAGLEKYFERRVHRSDWVMQYRLFRPAEARKGPLVMYLHGSGGSGDDNEKQITGGNLFGTHVWALPENQKWAPCYVVAPQTDRGWIAPSRRAGEVMPSIASGIGDGARLAHEIVEALCREFAIDEQRIYVVGQSMGGAGTWHMTAHFPRLFAAAVPCCGSVTIEDGARSVSTPLWNFHGDADHTVPVAISRRRIAALRKAGGQPLYTEYTGVGHNVWEWAFTEPALVKWVFAQRRAA